MSLMERAKNIVLQPKTEWPVIDAEQTSTGALYTGYIIPLAAIGPIAQIIGWSVFGMSLPFVGTFRIPIGYALRTGVITYVASLLGTFVLALSIYALAPTFGGQTGSNLSIALDLFIILATVKTVLRAKGA